MKKVAISAELERRLRAGDPLTIMEIVKLLDGLTGATGSKYPGRLGFKELVALFRSELGSALILPPSPDAGYIVKITNKAREFGISKENVGQIVKGLRSAYPRGPYSLGFVVNAADRHFDAGRSREGGEHLQETERARGQVYTGRVAELEGDEEQ